MRKQGCSQCDSRHPPPWIQRGSRRLSARLRDEPVVVVQPTEDGMGHEVAVLLGGS
jgi:hypothetical protein